MMNDGQGASRKKLHQHNWACPSPSEATMGEGACCVGGLLGKTKLFVLLKMGRKLRFEKPQVGQQGHKPAGQEPPLMDLMERERRSRKGW